MTNINRFIALLGILMVGSIYSSLSLACSNNICVGESVYASGDQHASTILGINTFNGTLAVKNNYTGTVSNHSFDAIAVTKGCNQDRSACTGDSAILNGDQHVSTIVGIFKDGFIYLRNNNTGKCVKAKASHVNMCSRQNGDSICIWHHHQEVY